MRHPWVDRHRGPRGLPERAPGYRPSPGVGLRAPRAEEVAPETTTGARTRARTQADGALTHPDGVLRMRQPSWLPRCLPQPRRRTTTEGPRAAASNAAGGPPHWLVPCFSAATCCSSPAVRTTLTVSTSRSAYATSTSPGISPTRRGTPCSSCSGDWRCGLSGHSCRSWERGRPVSRWKPWRSRRGVRLLAASPRSCCSTSSAAWASGGAPHWPARR